MPCFSISTFYVFRFLAIRKSPFKVRNGSIFFINRERDNINSASPPVASNIVSLPHFNSFFNPLIIFSMRPRVPKKTPEQIAETVSWPRIFSARRTLLFSMVFYFLAVSRFKWRSSARMGGRLGRTYLRFTSRLCRFPYNKWR